MPLTDNAVLIHLAEALGGATGLSVRLTERGQVTEYVSPLHLHPDPAGPALPVLLKETHRAGVYCTSLLQFSDDSLLEIANTFGFSSQSHFQNVFKSVTGETPMAFRRRIGNGKHIR